MITDFLGESTNYGDAFVVAPDGSRAGLVWETADDVYFAEVCAPTADRWGVWGVSQRLPMTTLSEAREYLAALVPELRARWQLWKRDAPTEQAEPEQSEQAVPSPSVVAAWLVLDLLPTERVPWWAAEWLARGMDGEALRALAGLNGRDPYAVRDLLPAVFEETAAAVPSDPLAAATAAFNDVARLYRQGKAGERWVAQKVDEIVAGANYAEGVYELPLGRLFGIDDEIELGGLSADEVRLLIQEACEQTR